MQANESVSDWAHATCRESILYWHSANTGVQDWAESSHKSSLGHITWRMFRSASQWWITSNCLTLVIVNICPLPSRKTSHNHDVLQLSLATDLCSPLESSYSLRCRLRQQTLNYLLLKICTTTKTWRASSYSTCSYYTQIRHELFESQETYSSLFYSMYGTLNT